MKKLAIFLFLPIVAFSQKEETISSGNSKLFFRTFGSGKPLLVINGGPGMNSEGFSNMAGELSKAEYQAITYDQRGTGKSVLPEVNDKTITMDLMVDDMENLRKHLKVDKWTILGHSFGGVMAAYYATKHPEHIEKLIFSSSGGINMKFTTYISRSIHNNLTQIQRDSLKYFQQKRENGDASLTTLKNRAKYLANAYVFDKSKAPIIAERLIQIDFNINALVIQNLHRMHFDCAVSFRYFNKPVLVLQGKNDIISVETAKEIAEAFPNSKLVLLEKCSHYGWLDAPELYFMTIRSFLNS